MLEKIINRVEVNTAVDALEKIRDSVTVPTKISSFTHNFYKYPACFPETFPRTVIRSFSKEDDWILDPFVGGGTAAVEALAANRNFVGSDINDLAVFSSRFKTTLLDSSDLKDIENIFQNFKLSRQKVIINQEHRIFFENVPNPISNFAVRAKDRLDALTRPRSHTFCLGVLLRLLQLELERDYDVTEQKLEDRYLALLETFLEKNLQYQASIQSFSFNFRPTVKILKSDVSNPGVVGDYMKTVSREFDLVVTSPPYPQRHILYNKWQIQGRSETRLPYWIIDSGEHFPESHYTMGHRESQTGLDLYLSLIHCAFSNVNSVLKKGGLAIQVVAFSNMKTQFYGFLDAMDAAGFEEVKNIDRKSYDGRLWRTVPNQKWYNRNKGNAGSCKEVILFHRKKRNI